MTAAILFNAVPVSSERKALWEGIVDVYEDLVDLEAITSYACSAFRAMRELLAEVAPLLHRASWAIAYTKGLVFAEALFFLPMALETGVNLYRALTNIKELTPEAWATLFEGCLSTLATGLMTAGDIGDTLLIFTEITSGWINWCYGVGAVISLLSLAFSCYQLWKLGSLENSLSQQLTSSSSTDPLPEAAQIDNYFSKYLHGKKISELTNVTRLSDHLKEYLSSERKILIAKMINTVITVTAIFLLVFPPTTFVGFAFLFSSAVISLALIAWKWKATDILRARILGNLQTAPDNPAIH